MAFCAFECKTEGFSSNVKHSCPLILFPSWCHWKQAFWGAATHLSLIHNPSWVISTVASSLLFQPDGLFPWTPWICLLEFILTSSEVLRFTFDDLHFFMFQAFLSVFSCWSYWFLLESRLTESWTIRPAYLLLYYAGNNVPPTSSRIILWAVVEDYRINQLASISHTPLLWAATCSQNNHDEMNTCCL